MEYVLEFIFDLLFEGGEEICRNRKISKWIRYPVFGLMVLVFAAIVGFLLVLGWALWKESILASLLLFAVAVAAIIGIALKVRREYLKYRS